MNFSLENYKKSEPAEEIPDWAQTEMARNLYAVTVLLFEEAKKTIETTKNPSLKQRRIILSKIANACGVSRSLITARRYPQLVAFVQEKNIELDDYLLSITRGRYTSGRKLSKNQLSERVRELEEEIARLTNLKISEALTTTLRENLTTVKSSLITMNEQLKLELSELREKNFNLVEANNRLLIALNRRPIKD
jgi:hypothetical protein